MSSCFFFGYVAVFWHIYPSFDYFFSKCVFSLYVLQYNKQHIIPLENVKLQSVPDEGRK